VRSLVAQGPWLYRPFKLAGPTCLEQLVQITGLSQTHLSRLGMFVLPSRIGEAFLSRDHGSQAFREATRSLTKAELSSVLVDQPRL